MRSHAQNTIARRKAGEVLRVIRNALAHGNVIYLDEQGFEKRHATVQFLAFLSRYEEDEVSRKHSETYRLVTTTEEGFLAFIKSWAKWLSSIEPDQRLVFVETA